MSLSNDVIQKIREDADIVDVIRQYISVEQKGKSYKAICPFHDDRNPSLSISQDKQMYKCFVCGQAGNVFTFIQDFEHVSFKEAVIKVSEIIGKPISRSLIQAVNTIDPEKKRLYEILEESIKFTKYTLHAEDGHTALQYLKKRGLTDELIDRFDIGFASNEQSLYRYLKAKNYTEEPMVGANLIRIGSNGAYDVFQNRILFPIHDQLGHPVGFTARAMADEDSKYINTAETKIYIKGNIVYNYHRALSDIKKAGHVFLTEGVMDVIAFHKVGILPVVASLGTALTLEQVRQLKKLNVKVILAYDGDKAGINATFKAGKLFQSANVEFEVMQTHHDLDPDDVIEKFGAQELVTLSKKTKAWLEFVFEYYQKRLDLTNYSEKKEFTKLVETEIALLQDDFDRQNFSHRLQQLTGFKLSPITISRSTELKKQVPQKVSIQEGYLKSEEIILKLMMNYPQAITKFKEELGFLMDDIHQRCALNMIDYYRKYGNINISSLIDEYDDQNYKNILMRLSMDEEITEEFNEALFDGAKRTIKLKMIELQVQQVQDNIKTVHNVTSKDALMNELHELQLQRRRLIDDEKD